jgi:DNA-binding NarL/FixJ family response regulator
MTAALTTVSVFIWATDPISKAGMAAAIRARSELTLVDSPGTGGDTVLLAVVDRLDDTVMRQLRAHRAQGQDRMVLVIGELTDADLLNAVELGVRGVALRAETSPDAVVGLVRTAASGAATLPPEVLGRLLTRVSMLQRQVLAPLGLSMAGLTEREIQVLRLVSQGLSTSEIAERLRYSERTIKTVLHDIVNRFQLRNRTHAVAYAMRQGLI